MPGDAQPLAWNAIMAVASGSGGAAMVEAGARSRGSKRRQMQGGVGTCSSQSSGSVSAEVVQRLLRDHLYLRQEVGMNLQSLGLAVLFRNEAAKTTMKNLVQHYHDHAPERAQSGKQPPHPLGFWNIFLFQGTLHTLKALGLGDAATAAIDMMSAMPPPDLDMVIGQYRAKHKQPMAERTWKWELALSCLATDVMRNHLATISAATKRLEDPPILVDVRHERAGQLEQACGRTSRRCRGRGSEDRPPVEVGRLGSGYFARRLVECAALSVASSGGFGAARAHVRRPRHGELRGAPPAARSGRFWFLSSQGRIDIWDDVLL